MAKVVTTVVAIENGMGVEEIFSFKTENWIGTWDFAHNDFVLIPKSSREFSVRFLGYKVNQYNSIQEFDNAVFNKCREHILEAFTHDECSFTVVLEDDGKKEDY